MKGARDRKKAAKRLGSVRNGAILMLNIVSSILKDV
jgi:hypothetical protein